MTSHDRNSLLERRARLEEELKAVERKLQAASIQEPAAPKASESSYTKQRPVRSLVLDALEDLGWPAYTREIALYCKARYGRDIPPTRFGSLMSDEVKSVHAGKRAQSVWLAFCFTNVRAEPIKRLLARSDWPLEQRIVAPSTGRIQHLKMTARLAELALKRDAVDEVMMNIITADHARDLPGVEVKRGQFDLERWRDIALALLEELEPKDLAARKEAAEKWGRYLHSPRLQFFGAPELVQGDRIILTGRRA